MGIVTLALVSHFWPLPEPAKSLERQQRHEAKRSELGGELCQRDNASKSHRAMKLNRPEFVCQRRLDPGPKADGFKLKVLTSVARYHKCLPATDLSPKFHPAVSRIRSSFGPIGPRQVDMREIA